jgi:hypothetical protein
MPNIELIPCEKRDALRSLIDVRSAADALASYYGLVHECERVQLYGYYPNNHSLSGFLAVAQTGIDLFRPLAVPFLGTRQALQEMVLGVLKPGRHYLIYLPVEQQEYLIGMAGLSQIMVSNLLRLDPRVFQPLLNVLVEQRHTPDGHPRFDIQSSNGFAAAGINWRTQYAAEIYAEGDQPGYRRGFTKAVLGALISQLIQEGLTVFLRIPDDDYRSFEDAFDLGFKPTGVRQLFADLLITDHDGAAGDSTA